MDFDAVVLAGGSGTRLGGIDKAGLQVGGMSLLDRVLRASAAARRTVVVGAARPVTRAVEWTLEQPPGSGPLAGLAAGVAVLEAAGPAAAGPALILVVATDLPHLRAADVDRLLTALADAEPHVGAAVFVDQSGQPQPLTAVYRRAELVRAIADQQPVAGRSMRSMLRRLTVAEVPDEGAATDIDTRDQLAAARAANRSGPGPSSETSNR